jgi:hypothetical protein
MQPAMSEPASPSLSNLDVSSSRVKGIIFGVILLAVLGVGGYVVFKLATAEPGAKACEHLAELRKTDPLADQVIDKLQHHVEAYVVRDNLVKGATAVKVEGSTPDERCHSAIDYLDKTMGHGPFTRMVDCIASAKSARGAASCF